jgi:predicted NBD/HSP70 family sugar kinase
VGGYGAGWPFAARQTPNLSLVADLRPILTTVAVADASGRFLSQESFQTPPEPQKTVAALAARFRHQMELHKELVFEGIGISLPGRFDEATRRVIFAPNLKWSGVDLGAPIERTTGLRVELENAANACVLAEAWFGHAENVRGLVVVTVSEGIGAGVFIDGHLIRGQKGMAGEFGHTPLDPNGPPCTCGNRGCWEVFASHRAALRYYHESGVASEDFTFQDLLALSEAGDALAASALEKMAQAIGRGMRTIILGLAPEEIVVVGEFTRQWQRLGPIIEAEVRGKIPVGNPPRIRPAAVDPRMARLRGAVALVLQKHCGLGSTFGEVEDSHRTDSRLAAV